MYYLERNVYLVNGKENGAVYDFNSGILYHLSNEAQNLLNKLIDGGKENFTETEVGFIQGLVEKHILTTDYVEKHNIFDLQINPKIDFVWIEITTGCNLKCIHCYDESSSLKKDVMSYSGFCHVIDEIVENGIHKMQIIGGEPLILGKELVRYLEYCKDKFEYIEIFTNGTLIDDFWVNYFKDNNIHIALSVYSYLESEHNRITQNEFSYKKTTTAIKKLNANGISYRVRNVLMSGLDLGEQNTTLYELSHKRDIVRMVGRANMRLLDEELLKCKLITAKNFSGKLNKDLVSRSVSGHNCFSRRLYFSTNLEVYPCVMERRVSHGNLNGKKLCDVIDSSITKFSKDKIDGCKECEFRYSCFDCRPDSLDDEINKKPWFCTYNPEKGEWEDVNSFVKELIKYNNF